jgi:asparagine synthase (glutamine-hydrolysing)
MCGLTGFIDYNNQSTEENLRIMTNALTHRGPDSFGLKVLNEKSSIIGLGHTRLSIIDLSKNGDQPMQYGSNTIIFNGEIYNFKEVRQELIDAGIKFETNSDTEVVLKAFIHWGTSSVHHFIGMFVYVIYDAKNSELYIFRDRPGVNPLYYYYKDGLFLFGSELKSFHLHPSFHKELNFDALAFYLKYGYVNTPNCIFKHCAKLRPGHYLKISTKEYKIEELKYWDVLDFITDQS